MRLFRHTNNSRSEVEENRVPDSQHEDAERSYRSLGNRFHREASESGITASGAPDFGVIMYSCGEMESAINAALKKKGD